MNTTKHTQWIHRLTLGKRLALGFGLSLAVLALVAFIGINRLHLVNEGYRGQVLPQVAHEGEVAKLDQAVTKARMLQLDYTQNRNLQALAEAKTLLTEGQNTAQRLAADQGTSTLNANTSALQELSQGFGAQFADLQALERAQTRRGLTDEEGIRGKFRQAARAVETLLKSRSMDAAGLWLPRLREFLARYRQNPNPTHATTLGWGLNQLALSLGGNPNLQARLHALSEGLTKNPPDRNLMPQVERELVLAGEEARRSQVINALPLYLEMRRAEKDFLLRGDLMKINEVQNNLEALRQAVQLSGLASQVRQEVEVNLETYSAAFNSLMEVELDKAQLEETLLQRATQMHGQLNQILVQERSETQGMINRISAGASLAVSFMWGVSGLGILLTGVLAGLFIRSITQLLVNLVQNLIHASGEVASASSGISQSSVTLSQRTSQQAASLEQTSAAIEQLEGQTRNNAATATATASEMQEIAGMAQAAAQSGVQAQDLSREADDAANDGVVAMGQISGSMSEIAAAAEKITNIIEVINEITHQTKMLATNAAIEAARAGETGKGFAVVADEVSKLAENSKSAAKEIAGLIKESAEKARLGAVHVGTGERALAKIKEKALEVHRKLEDLAQSSREQANRIASVSGKVGQITQASNEQAKGVEEIRLALVEMDQSTQSNATSAEETANSAEQLAAQAETLRSLVNQVGAQVGAASTQAAVTGNQPPKAGFFPRSSAAPAANPEQAKGPAPRLEAPASSLLATGLAPGKPLPKGKKPAAGKAVPQRGNFNGF